MPSPAAAGERCQEGFSRAGFLKTVFWKSVMQFVFEETIRAYVHVLLRVVAGTDSLNWMEGELIVASDDTHDGFCCQHALKMQVIRSFYLSVSVSRDLLCSSVHMQAAVFQGDLQHLTWRARERERKSL